MASERLTDEELMIVEQIVEARRPDADQLEGTRLIGTLVAEVRALRELLAELEWTSCEYPEGAHACPVCRAFAEERTSRQESTFVVDLVGQHAPGCKLARAIGVQL